MIYEPTEYFEYEEWLKAEQYFEGEIQFLNETFKLPYDVEIVIADSSYDPNCEYPNAFYYPKEIVICYEYISHTNWKFKDYFDSKLILIRKLMQQKSNIIFDEDLNIAK